MGFLVTGFALDDRFVAAVKRLTSSDVAFRYGQKIVSSSFYRDPAAGSCGP